MQNSFWAKVMTASRMTFNVTSGPVISAGAINVSISENAVCPQLESNTALPTVSLSEASRKNCRRLKYCSGISPILLVDMLYF